MKIDISPRTIRHGDKRCVLRCGVGCSLGTLGAGDSYLPSISRSRSLMGGRRSGARTTPSSGRGGARAGTGLEYS